MTFITLPNRLNEDKTNNNIVELATNASTSCCIYHPKVMMEVKNKMIEKQMFLHL